MPRKPTSIDSVTLLWVGIVAALGGLWIWFINRRKGSAMLTAAQNTSGVVVRGTSLPMTDTAVYSSQDRNKITQRMRELVNKYGDQIYAASQATGISVNEGVAFMFVEIEYSNPDTARSAAGAIGAMQITPNTPVEILYLANKKGLLTPKAKDELRKHLNRANVISADDAKLLTGKVSDWQGKEVDSVTFITNLKSNPVHSRDKGKWWYITAQDLYNSNINILIGFVYLSLLVKEETKGGKTNYANIVKRYNAGYYVKPAFANSSETKAYVAKIAGQNGALELAIKGNVG